MAPQARLCSGVPVIVFQAENKGDYWSAYLCNPGEEGAVQAIQEGVQLLLLGLRHVGAQQLIAC